MWHDIVNLHLNHSVAMVVDLSICILNGEKTADKRDRGQNVEKKKEKEKKSSLEWSLLFICIDNSYQISFLRLKFGIAFERPYTHLEYYFVVN